MMGIVVLPIIQREYLGLHVSVVVVLEEESGGLGVIFPCSDVQRRQADFPLSVVFQQEGNNLVMALLQRHRQRSETILWTGRNSYDQEVAEGQTLNVSFKKKLRS